MVKVVFLASIREKLGCEQQAVELSGSSLSVAALVEQLVADDARYQLLQRDKVLVAVNQQMAKADTLVAAGDEVAFFPPVTGG